MTVLRPSKIHGAGARGRASGCSSNARSTGARPCSWRTVEDGVDHTTASGNLAALIETVAARRAARILNSADPDAPTAVEISRAIARRSVTTGRRCLVDGDEAGRHPWDKLPPSCST